MVAEAAEIAWANVSAEQFLTMVGLIVLQHEIIMKDTCTTLLIM